MAETTTTRFIVTGLVQGVGFRDWTRRTARRQALDGWVRNRRDGTVEAVVSGPAAAVATMRAAIAGGPHSGRVDHVEETAWDEPVAPGFEIRPTA